MTIKAKYLKNRNSFKGEIKSIFHHFTGLSLKQIKQTFLEDRTLSSGIHFKQCLTLSDNLLQHVLKGP